MREVQHHPQRTAITPRARQLRRDMTPTEVILWGVLRGRQFGGYKFRRQQPLGPFFADFYCAEAKLVVELDGDTHIGREAEDAARRAFLASEGIAVIRFWNPEVHDNLEGVCSTILTTCTSRAPDPAPHARAASPPSPLGGVGRGEARGVRGLTTSDEDQQPRPQIQQYRSPDNRP
jgi:very-short-patch-repair endonuclease